MPAARISQNYPFISKVTEVIPDEEYNQSDRNYPFSSNGTEIIPN